VSAFEPSSRIPRTLWDILDLDPDKIMELGGSGRGLGGFLLQGTRWRAILDLKDPEAEGRLRDYVETKIPGVAAPQIRDKEFSDERI